MLTSIALLAGEVVIAGRNTDPNVVVVKVTPCCCVRVVLEPPRTTSWLAELPPQEIVNDDDDTASMLTNGNNRTFPMSQGSRRIVSVLEVIVKIDVLI